MATTEDKIIDLQEELQSLDNSMTTIRDRKATVVCIGESSHGTHEFYHWRNRLTKLLIESGQCYGVCIEGDFPDALELHRYVTGSSDKSIDEVFNGFERFPSWMWANYDMKRFVAWLREHNAKFNSPSEMCGIYGLDLYSLQSSMASIVTFLEKDPANKKVADKVKVDYACFNALEPQTYGLLAERGLIKGCHKAAVDGLKQITRGGTTKVKTRDETFFNELNAHVVVNAEVYYRTMFDPQASSWNVRDSHFFEQLKRIRAHLGETASGDGTVVWAHNSHIGDARFSHLEKDSHNRDLNIGQLVRENLADTLLIGQFMYDGKVCAANDWDGDHKFKRVRPSLANSLGDLLQSVSQKSQLPAFGLDLRNPKLKRVLDKTRLQRAIGVIYRPDTERWSHYYTCDVVNQFDFITFFSHTKNVVPLVGHEMHTGEIETYPSGL